MESLNVHFPTDLHQKAAEEITGFFSQINETKAVLLTCSCARGKASKDSCLDIAVLHSPSIGTDRMQVIVEEWNKEHSTNRIYEELRSVGIYSHIDLEFIDGDFSEGEHGWTTGPDAFELEIGNFIAYSIPLFNKDSYFDDLKLKWLPYYDEERRQKRLTMVKDYCLNNLRHIPGYVQRQLYFQSFKRLYDAMGEFMQALFISNKIYPIAYDKWIKDQLYNLIKIPNIYPELVKMMEYEKFESSEHMAKAEKLEEMLSVYCRN